MNRKLFRNKASTSLRVIDMKIKQFNKQITKLAFKHHLSSEEQNMYI